MSKLTQSKVKELFNYNPVTGLLTRRISVFAGKGAVCAKKGTIAGSPCPTGYLTVGIEGTTYLVHRVIWLWLHGYCPEQHIDHINKIKTDNRELNLREATRHCNMRNSSVRNDSTTGVKGVYWAKERGKYCAMIQYGKKRRNLGYSLDLIEAAALRLAAEQCLGWLGCESKSTALSTIRKFLTV